jgi:hypothetical protein
MTIDGAKCTAFRFAFPLIIGIAFQTGNRPEPGETTHMTKKALITGVTGQDGAYLSETVRDGGGPPRRDCV